MEQDSEPQCYYTYTVGMKKIGNPKDRTEIGEAIKIEFMSDMLICTQLFRYKVGLQPISFLNCVVK